MIRSPALLGAALTLLLAGAAAADTVVDTFTGNVNQGGWSFGVPATFNPTGGNPGVFVSGFVDTFAPQCRTGGGGSNPFLGDWRAMNVASVGADFRVGSTQFAFARECTLILSAGSVQVYFVHADLIPQVAQGWRSFDFPLDPHSPTLPAGWAVHPNSSVQNGNAAWTTVMGGVTEVRWLFGHPDFFYIFDQWLVGVDNPRLDCVDPWVDLGGGTAGIAGVPQLETTGLLLPDTTLALQLSQTAPGALALLWISGSSTPFAALGGTVHAFPTVAELLLGTSLGGEVGGAVTFAGAPPGTEIWFQFICQDASTIYGLTLSNATKGTVP